jgi:hypothetical protein
MLSVRYITPIILFCLPLHLGCGGNLASVSGTVTIDGQPVAGSEQLYGTVSFYREQGGGAPAIAIIDGSGQYNLRTGSQAGVEPGTYLVGIAIKKITASTTPGGMPQAKLISPLRYASVSQSGFREVVAAGANQIDFELSSK